ncbi:transcriptional regulator, DeoR family [Conexibacter woesei DSM 14684]|uniref:Transcriptional regulator, DeoR family n=1 Tax=Conexibacter woesei (strain DSM 14684 / CCUG 47730 / CIP 108061 / JCM 11494 / NBRC 100937 / ID131577) TaxID=469383 RepID=D3FC70_CONWI|nr:transcriptional regulator, DeoR family [Conexibacter woesei DSM 14684]
MAAEGPPGRPLLAEARRFAIAELLRSAGAVSVTEVETRFGVSPMTARRDLMALEKQGVARRTHGGAVLPSMSAKEDSFAKRVNLAAGAKGRLADAAVEMVVPEETIVLDSSSTAYFLAQRIVDRGLAVTIITNSLPIMDLVAGVESPPIHLVAVGGTLRRLTGSFVGPYAVETVRGHFADRMFMSVKGLTPGGVMTDADELEAELKRAMIAQSQETVLLVDGSKLSVRGQNAIAHVRELTSVLAEGLAEPDLDALRATGVAVRSVDEADPADPGPAGPGPEPL